VQNAPWQRRDSSAAESRVPTTWVISRLVGARLGCQTLLVRALGVRVVRVFLLGDHSAFSLRFPGALFAPDPVAVSIKAVDVVSDDRHRTRNIGWTVAATALTVHVTGHRYAGTRVIRVAWSALRCWGQGDPGGEQNCQQSYFSHGGKR
jgi:hypothetical protein